MVELIVRPTFTSVSNNSAFSRSCSYSQVLRMTFAASTANASSSC